MRSAFEVLGVRAVLSCEGIIDTANGECVTMATCMIIKSFVPTFRYTDLCFSSFMFANNFILGRHLIQCDFVLFIAVHPIGQAV